MCCDERCSFCPTQYASQPREAKHNSRNQIRGNSACEQSIGHRRRLTLHDPFCIMDGGGSRLDMADQNQRPGLKREMQEQRKWNTNPS